MLDKITVKERTSVVTDGLSTGGTSYKLNGEGLRLFDFTHRAFTSMASDSHGIEEFVIKHTGLLGAKDVTRDSITEAVSIALLGKHSLLIRMVSALIRARLSDKTEPGCLGEPETPLDQLDWLLTFCFKIIDNVRSSKAGVRLLRTGSEVDARWDRPVFGAKMRLRDLVHRTDLNGLTGIYFGKQEGRFCVTMAEHGKLLAKSSNTIPLMDPSTCGSYSVSLLHLLEEMGDLPKEAISEICAKMVKGLAERLVEATGVVSVRGSPSASAVMQSEDGVEEAAKRAQLGKQRQEMLMKRMKERQAQFRSNDTSTAAAEERETPETGPMTHECSMCRESGNVQSEDPIVAIGYCASGNSLTRTSPPGACLATPAAPYVSACLHTVHLSCWAKHCSAQASRHTRGDYSLVRADNGEVQCPVCRSLSNIAIPALDRSLTLTPTTAEAVVALGQSLLDLSRDSAMDQSPSSASAMDQLWLARTGGKPWRPVILSPTVDALIEATFNELLLSIAISPSKILSPFSLPILLVRCVAASLTRQSADWGVWTKSSREAEKADCARLFLESGKYTNASFVRSVLALRHLQLLASGVDKAEYFKQLAHLAVFIAWVAVSVTDFAAADINRIGYLPEDSEAKLTVIESVLGVADWREEIARIEAVVKLRTPSPGTLVAPHAMGGLVEFIPLPETLIDLIQHTLDRVCSRCKTRPQEPAICLVCGDMLCLDSDCCKSEEGEGECTQHAKICGAGQGVFILPFTSIVVAVGCPRNCIWEGPYEDSHGEPDSYLKRSCMLRLSQRRLDQMRLFYTRGTIPMEIVRQNQLTGRYVPRQL